MSIEVTKRKLIDVTKTLLLTSETPEKITARKISTEANVNLAMINYCFGSKDELIKSVTNEIVENEFLQYSISEDTSLRPKDRLKNLLYRVSEVTIRYASITKLSIPYVLLNAPIEIPLEILPYIKEHFGPKKDDQFCKIIAYEIVSLMQIVLYREKDFQKYSGIDLNNTSNLRQFIESQINIFLGDDINERDS